MKPIIIICAVLLLTGCYSRKKAQVQHGRAVSTFPEIGADYCARTYPVIAKTDSTGYKDSKRVIDSLANAIKTDSLLSDKERDRLINEVALIRASIPHSENCDSLYDALYRLAAQQVARADRLQGINTQLIQAANNLKPIRDTIVDHAALDLCNITRNNAILLATDYKTKYDKWRDIAKKRFFIILGMGLVIALGLFGMIRKRLANLSYNVD